MRKIRAEVSPFMRSRVSPFMCGELLYLVDIVSIEESLGSKLALSHEPKVLGEDFGF